MFTGSEFDVIVIGGGPSGMMAAGHAGERGRRVLLVEKNKELGKKLSITGGGRCNILNAEEDRHALLKNFGDAAKYLYSPFSQHGMEDSRAFFEEKGLPIVVEARKRAFPESQHAPDVTRVMKRYATSSGVELKLGTKVYGFMVEAGTITGIKTKNGDYRAKSFVLATGGSSHKETGSTGEGFDWLKALGHTVHTPNPNIVPLIAHEEWVKKLSGTTLSFMKITFGADRSKVGGRFSRTGKILFTHFGISGPLVLNAAQKVQELLLGGPVHATIDLYPDTEVGTLRNRIVELFNRNKNKDLKNVLRECTPEGMTEAVAALLPTHLPNTKVHSVSREERHLLVDILKAMPLTITDTKGMDWAVVSDGGVDLSEVDMRTMRSKKYDNLYFTGDVLNISRPSGGYSLQLCWTTGWAAGSHV